MDNVLGLIYRFLPKKYVRLVGSSKLLQPVRDFILRKKGKSRTTIVNAHWAPENLDFIFETDIKTSVRAKNRGIESSLLRLSLTLLDFKKSARDKIVFDIGSSYGYLSIVWAKTISENGKVFSFEASPHVFKSLTHNVSTNRLDNTIVPVNQPVFSKKAKVRVENSPSSSHIDLNNPDEADSRFLLESVSLDDFADENHIQKIDLIKIDVDGVEYEILLGAENVIKTFKPVVIVEPNQDSRITDFMRARGYSLFDMKMIPYENGNPSNMICLPANI